jgi:hypothetical protein
MEVTAQDIAGIFANVKLVSSATTTNDGGTRVLQDEINNFLPSDFLSSEGSRAIKFGQRVRIASGFADPDVHPGTVYEWMGADATVDLNDPTHSYTESLVAGHRDAADPATINFSVPGGDHGRARGDQHLRSLVESYITGDCHRRRAARHRRARHGDDDARAGPPLRLRRQHDNGAGIDRQQRRSPPTSPEQRQRSSSRATSPHRAGAIALDATNASVLTADTESTTVSAGTRSAC